MARKHSRLSWVVLGTNIAKKWGALTALKAAGGLQEESTSPGNSNQESIECLLSAHVGKNY